MLARLFAAVAAGLVLFASQSVSAAAPPPTAEEAARVQQLQTLLDSLHPRTGTVVLPEAQVTLNLGEDYYLLDAAEAKQVLTEGWGNPPGTVTDVIGMVFPAGRTFVDDTWGAVLTFVGDGYVSDSDAATIDYDALLAQLRSGEDADNRAREAAGFETSHLVGWAQEPSYDAAAHTLIWAKEISFSDTPGANTLNYDVRVLGRRGAFSMNLVTGMDQLEATRTDATRLMQAVSFNEGARYADYQEGVDPKAAYGVAGLIAGGAAVALAKKAGLLGILLIVLKKGGVFIFAGLAAAFAWIRNRFMGKKGGEFGTASRDLAPAPAAADADAVAAPAPQDDAASDDTPRTS